MSQALCCTWGPRNSKTGHLPKGGYRLYQLKGLDQSFFSTDFLGGSDTKESACNVEHRIQSLVREDPLDK